MLPFNSARNNGELHSDSVNRGYLQSLAAAHAESGDFAQTIVIRKEVLEKYSTARRASDIGRERLRLLKLGLPIREYGGSIARP